MFLSFFHRLLLHVTYVSATDRVENTASSYCIQLLPCNCCVPGNMLVCGVVTQHRLLHICLFRFHYLSTVYMPQNFWGYIIPWVGNLEEVLSVQPDLRFIVMLIIVHIFAVFETIFLFTLHVSTLMGHHPVLFATQSNILVFTFTYIGHNRSLSFFFFYAFGDVT
jgi:hypothetical protein